MGEIKLVAEGLKLSDGSLTNGLHEIRAEMPQLGQSMLPGVNGKLKLVHALKVLLSGERLQPPLANVVQFFELLLDRPRDLVWGE